MAEPPTTDSPPASTAGQRIIKLLWEPADATPARGPRPKLSLAEIVDTGVAIADAEGLDALSMRKVAGRLGVGAMSLYTYLPGRSELIELMIDRVYADHAMANAEVAAGSKLAISVEAAPKPAVAGWRQQMENWIYRTWRVYVRHPWLLDYNMARLPIGPHVLDVEESLYAAVLAAGFDAADNVALSNVIRWQLLGAARALIGDAVEERHTGVSVEAYWESRFSFWSSYFDEARFPTMAAIWAKGGFDDPAGYDIDRMITWLLDGIERLAPASISGRGEGVSRELQADPDSAGSTEVQVVPEGRAQPEGGQAGED